VHGYLRPSDILGVADQLKITSDGLRPASERVPAPANRSVHDPPESAAGIISPAGDIWSLGITLIEALTQRPPLPRRSPRKPPVLPGSLPPLYLDVARQCLQPDPSRRPTAAGLTERLRKQLPTEEALRPVTPRRSLRIWRYAVPVAFLALAGSGVHYRASKGDAIAQADLGFLYSQGHGVPQACQKAARLVSLGGRAGICTSRP